MSVTQQQVAELAGVTRATVSYVLAGRAAQLHITDAVARRVQDAARQLAYTPNHSARSLVSGRTRTLGLLMGGADGRVAPFWSLIAMGVQSAACEAGYDALLIRGRAHSLEDGVSYLRERRVDALVVLGQPAAGATPTAWANAPVPPVVMQFSGARGLPCVGLDPRPGLAGAIDHLATQGHRHVLWIEPRFGAGATGTVGGRAEIVRSLGRDCGMTVRVVRLAAPPSVRLLPTEEQVGAWRESLASALPKRSAASAVLCWNDHIALGLYDHFRGCGIRVPEDVSVVGFDDLHAASALPALSTVSFEFGPLGAAAARLAIRLAEGTLAAEQACKTVELVPSRFVPRASTGPAERSCPIVLQEEIQET